MNVGEDTITQYPLLETQEEKFFHHHIKKNKIPRNKPKEAKQLYSENYRMLMKEMKDDTDGKIHHGLGLEESILLK